MYEVSAQYEQQMRQSFRNESLIKIKFGLVDPDAVSNAYVADTSPKVSFSTNPELVDDLNVSELYATLEKNFWLLDGSMKVLPDAAPYAHQGYISQELSDDTCEYEGGIGITIKFNTGFYNFRGMTLTFDPIQDNYPTEVTITGSLEGEQVFSATQSITSAEYLIETNIPYVDSLTFIFNKNKLPGRRLRIQDLILGVIKVIDSATLSSSTWTRENDLMNTVLSSNEFTFTFFDIKGEYNPDNPEGIWEYLDRGQSIDVKYGYTLNDGTVTWIPGATLYTDGTPSVKNAGSLSEVTFSATSRLQMLTDTYDVDVYSAAGRTLYTLAESLLQWSGLSATDYTLCDKMRNYTFYGVLPSQEVRELLQLIANASMCLLSVDRNGKIVFSERETQVEDFKYSLDEILDAAPSINKYPYLKNLYAYVYKYTVASTAESIASLEVSGATNQDFEITYSAATDVTISSNSGITVNSIKGTYANKMIVNLTGTGTLEISGKTINSSTSKVSKQFNVVGEDCELDNMLICSSDHANEYVDWSGEILNLRNVYTFNDRGFPEVDVADKINIETLFTEDKEVFITGSSITYNGGLSGSTEVLG